MPIPFGSAGRVDLDPERQDIVVPMLESQGFRQLAAAHIYGASVRLAPALDDKLMLADHVREELEHFEAAAAVYDGLGAGDLLAEVGERARTQVTMPASWIEVAMVQFLFERAGKFQLRECQHSSYAPYAEIIGRILAEQSGHDAAGEANLRQLLQTDHPNPGAGVIAQQYFARWLRISLLSFGRPGTRRDRRAVELGLKARTSAEVIRDYLRDLEPAVADCGLRFPSRKSLELELPDDVLAAR